MKGNKLQKSIYSFLLVVGMVGVSTPLVIAQTTTADIDVIPGPLGFDETNPALAVMEFPSYQIGPTTPVIEETSNSMIKIVDYRGKGVSSNWIVTVADRTPDENAKAFKNNGMIIQLKPEVVLGNLDGVNIYNGTISTVPYTVIESIDKMDSTMEYNVENNASIHITKNKILAGTDYMAVIEWTIAPLP